MKLESGLLDTKNSGLELGKKLDRHLVNYHGCELLRAFIMAVLLL